MWVSFGPKDLIGHYTITATSLVNTSAACEDPANSGNCSQVLEFYHGDPVDLIAMANPQGMASFDVDPTSSGTVQAKVVDVKGNTVTGELVRYSLGTPTYPGGPYNVTAPPSISATSAPVGVGGFSTITFTPGSFATLEAPDYNATATGMVTVTATWTNRSGVDINRNVTFIWKNYPYLGITVCPQTCARMQKWGTRSILP